MTSSGKLAGAASAQDAAAGEYPHDRCIHELFEAQAAARPDATALVFGCEHLTYRELNERANRLARVLRGLGVGPDVLVAMYLERSPELVIGVLAILKAGGAYLPIDRSYPAERLAFMLADSQAPVLLTESNLIRDLPATAARVVCVDDALPAAAAANDGQNLLPVAGPDHLAYVIYTSGTTGKPKGSLITHRNVARLFSATDDWYRFNERDVWTLFHSCAFDFSVWEIWGALLYGGRLVVVPFMVSRSPEAFYELLVKERVTVLNQTPSAFRQLSRAEESAGQKELALRCVIFGGEALEMQSLRPWFERHGDQHPRLVNMYGITETTVHVTYRPLSREDVQSGSVIGVPIPDLQVYILDPQGRPVPMGEAGEMYVGGAGLARGYLNRPELTAERFVPDHLSGRPGARLYRTGDLARFVAGHDIEYLGRLDHQVKIRGFRIELGEIEAALWQHPAVSECVVTAHAQGEEKRLVAYLAPKDGLRPSRAELRGFLARQLPEYMVPAHYVWLAEMPLTANGKIDRRALPEPDFAERETTAAYVGPQNGLEETIAGVWQSVLGLPQVGTKENFFEMGGTSLSMVRVQERLQEVLSRKLMIADLFQYPTVASLAAYLGQAGDKQSAQRRAVTDRAARQREALTHGRARRPSARG